MDRVGGLYLGFGLSEAAGPEDAARAIEYVLERIGMGLPDLAGLATIDRRADHPAILYLTDHMRVPVRLLSAQQLEAETPRLINPSEKIFALIGCHGVAEAAALVQAGGNAEFLIEKTHIGRVSIAIARS